MKDRQDLEEPIQITYERIKIVTSKTIRIEDATRGRHLGISLLDIATKKLEKLLKDILERKYKI